jgi:hypothetical protein
MIDYRKLLKDVIRGAVWDHDLPAAPAALDTSNETAELTAFFQLLDEVLVEQGETRAMVFREVEQMKREIRD